MAMDLVEVVPLSQIRTARSIGNAVCRVQDPDGQRQCRGSAPRQSDTKATRQEDRPDGRHGGRVQAEKMPQRKRRPCPPVCPLRGDERCCHKIKSTEGSGFAGGDTTDV